MKTLITSLIVRFFNNLKTKKKKKRVKMASIMRKLVSKKKRRFEWGGFDLDLSYITDRIIGTYVI